VEGVMLPKPTDWRRLEGRGNKEKINKRPLA
jgi:hypothetical protein